MSSLSGRSIRADSIQVDSSGSSGVAVAEQQEIVAEYSAGRLKRFGLAGLGVGFVFLAAVGVVLPGLPATGPLILASVCLTKSCPWLERRLVRSRFFAPFHRYLDGNAEMPLKARIVAMAMMWICILVSCFSLVRSEMASNWVIMGLVAAGFVGTWVIWRYGRRSTKKPGESV